MKYYIPIDALPHYKRPGRSTHNTDPPSTCTAGSHGQALVARWRAAYARLHGASPLYRASYILCYSVRSYYWDAWRCTARAVGAPRQSCLAPPPCANSPYRYSRRPRPMPLLGSCPHHVDLYNNTHGETRHGLILELVDSIFHLKLRCEDSGTALNSSLEFHVVLLMCSFGSRREHEANKHHQCRNVPMGGTRQDNLLTVREFLFLLTGGLFDVLVAKKAPDLLFNPFLATNLFGLVPECKTWHCYVSWEISGCLVTTCLPQTLKPKI